MLTLGFKRGRLPRCYFATTPTSMVKRQMGLEAYTDALSLPVGTTVGGRAIPNSGAGVVNTTATILAITAALHAGKTVVVDSAAPFAFTLPAATGTGDKYEFYIDTAATATSSTISSASATDYMAGVCWALTTASANAIGYQATATSAVISLNGTTKGGVPGDKIVLIDVKASTWSVQMFTAPTGTTATPFSHG